MKTHPMYLTDSYRAEMDAEILEVFPEGPNRYRVILDTTVFYPMGGGQPTDQGVLVSDGWSGNVYMVMMKDGEIGHFVECGTEPHAGVTVHGKIDWERRYRNMKVHSAGHVVDFAMHLLGYSPSVLRPLKGDHGKKPYIVYTGTTGKDFREELEGKSNELIGKALPLTTAFVPLDELTKDAIYLQPNLPANKPLRKLTLDGVGSVADGGTQVKHTGELGHVTIVSVREENGNTTVVYTVT